MPTTKKGKRRKASVPAWELEQNRQSYQANQDIEQGDFGTFEEMKALLTKFSRSPCSLNHRQETELSEKMRKMTHAPEGDPEKQAVIEFAESNPHCASIAKHLKDPKNVGEAW